MVWVLFYPRLAIQFLSSFLSLCTITVGLLYVRSVGYDACVGRAEYV